MRRIQGLVTNCKFSVGLRPNRKMGFKPLLLEAISLTESAQIYGKGNWAKF